MLNKENNQDASSINNSNVNQAGGDININNGLQIADIIPLVDALVKSKLEEYSLQAYITAKERANSFGKRLVEEVTQKVLDHINRFNEPAIQYSTRRAALGYIKSGDKKEGEELIDLLIERIRSEEHSTIQNIIDQAIEILPSLSRNAISLLILMAYRGLSLNGPRDKYMGWLRSVDQVLEGCDKITPIDIAYLQQANCTFGIGGVFPNERFESQLLKSADLFFRHDITGGQYDVLLNIFGLKDSEGGIEIGKNKIQEFSKYAYLIDFEPTQHLGRINVTSTDILNKSIGQPQYSEELREKIQKASRLGPPFTEDEVKDYLIKLNSNWKFALDLLDRNDVRTEKPTLLGYYIASRELTKLSGQKIGLDIFYDK